MAFQQAEDEGAVLDISRRGSSDDYGFSTIRLNNLKASWDPETESIILTDKGVSDFNTHSHHDYKIRVSLAELGRMLRTISKDVCSTSCERI